jgi:hypothetical protein
MAAESDSDVELDGMDLENQEAADDVDDDDGPTLEAGAVSNWCLNIIERSGESW